MTSLLWFVALVIGGVGGALNALLSDHARLLPSIITLTPGGTRVVRIGIVGNILTGAAVTPCLFWAMQAAGSTLNANGSLGLVLLGLERSVHLVRVGALGDERGRQACIAQSGVQSRECAGGAS